MNEKIDFEILEKDLKRFGLFYFMIWAINLALFIGQFAYYYFNQVDIDLVFIFFVILNILSLYLTYKINDRYSFLKYRYNYYKNTQ
jgi:membrane protein implicated in regulation of membrane protease activity